MTDDRKRETGGEVDDRERILSDFFADRRNAAGDYWCKQMAWEAHQSIVAEQSRALAESRAKVAELETPQIHRPEAPGWYWLIGPGEPRAVQVFDNDGHGLRVVDYDGESYDLMDPFLMLFRWYGPIQPPEKTP